LYSYLPGKSTIVPPLYFNSNGVSRESAAMEGGQYVLENDPYILSSISELEGKTFWIGEKVYYVTLPWIEILGRYLDKDLTMFSVGFVLFDF
jgi:hypothetical protein